MRMIVTDADGHLVETTTPGPGFLVHFKVAGLDVRIEGLDEIEGASPEEAVERLRSRLRQMV